MKKYSKWLPATIILAIASCSDPEENPGIQTNKHAQPEQAFIGQTGTIKSGKLYGIDITYTEIGNQKVFEGDIILTEEQLSQISGANGRTEGAGTSNLAARWPNYMVYYTIDPALPNQARVTEAISHWQANSSLRFAVRTNQSNYIVFRPGDGCSSYVGMIGGVQYVTLATGCDRGAAIHEIGHAIGLFHEQSRADRDNQIRILYQNIQSGHEHNFDKYSGGFDHGSFDFGSIMMYPPYAFSSNGQPTITRLDGSLYTVNRSGLSGGDIAIARTMYPSTTNYATVYADCNFSGAAVGLGVGDYNLSAMTSRGIGNDWMSSLRVTSGYRVTLYEHDGFTGASLVVTSDNSCLVGAGWNDRASSMRVATNGSFSTTIEAESYVSMSGVITEPCSEGGLNVGSFDAGNWTAYNVNIPTAGTYRVTYRVASIYSGRSLRLERANGTVNLGTIGIPYTGGWQNWTSISHNVSLPAGAYSIGIATSTGGFNINRFSITQL